MPLDPALQRLVDHAGQAGRSMSLRSGSVADARAAYELMASLGGPAPHLAGVHDRALPGPAGDLAARVYTPVGEPPFPLVVYLHGGGWTIGSIASHDPVCRQLAAQAEAVVVSLGYRLAPEHPFPAAVQDAGAAVSWLAEHGAELGADPTRLAVAGDSAGANLATVTAILARDRGGPAICFQALVYPVTDARGGYPSIDENGEGPFLTADTMGWFAEQYGRDEGDRLDWRMSPVLAHDLSGLPPALVITAEYDPLRDEGEAYGERLRAAGNAVTVRRYPGMAHAFFQMAGVLEGAREAMAETATALRLAVGVTRA